MTVELTQNEIAYLIILLDLKRRFLSGDEAEYHEAMCKNIQEKLKK